MRQHTCLGYCVFGIHAPIIWHDMAKTSWIITLRLYKKDVVSTERHHSFFSICVRVYLYIVRFTCI